MSVVVVMMASGDVVMWWCWRMRDVRFVVVVVVNEVMPVVVSDEYGQW